MASSVFEGDVKKNLLERTEAEKVFRPWWDTLEDYLLNILIVLGQTVKHLVLRKFKVTIMQPCQQDVLVADSISLRSVASGKLLPFDSDRERLRNCLTFYIF